MSNGDGNVAAIRKASVQARAKGEQGGPSLLLWMGAASQIVSPWWSKQRDADLRKFWRQVDHLSGAIYTMESRLTTVPFRVVPRDMTVKAHARLAFEAEMRLREDSEFGAGWEKFYSKFVEDLLSQDNGGFGEIIGDGRPDGPIKGPALGVAHLDSWRCTRTGDPEFPVIYMDTDGNRYKLHFTRVMFASQMPSPKVEMNDVGFCAVSRCVNVAQSILDVLVYRQEKLGSRPHRSIIVPQGGLDPDDIRAAFTIADEAMDNALLSRYSKNVVVGHSNLPDADLKLIDLAGLPDGFDEQQSVTLSMAAIALAFGVDARELFPAMQAGATRADALISHLKQRGKGPAQIMRETTTAINYKFLPPQLTFEFDFQDDEQDAQVADIKKVRSDRHMEDVTSTIKDLHTVREEMLGDGDLTDAQYFRLELAEGRLEDGSDVLSLFYNPDFASVLDLGAEDPLDVAANDAQEMRLAIEKARRGALRLQGSAGSETIKKQAMLALAALDRLGQYYGKPVGTPVQPKAQAVASKPVSQIGNLSPKEPSPEDLELQKSGASWLNRLFGRKAVAETIGTMREAVDRLAEAQRQGDV